MERSTLVRLPRLLKGAERASGRGWAADDVSMRRSREPEWRARGRSERGSLVVDEVAVRRGDTWAPAQLYLRQEQAQSGTYTLLLCGEPEREVVGDKPPDAGIAFSRGGPPATWCALLKCLRPVCRLVFCFCSACF